MGSTGSVLVRQKPGLITLSVRALEVASFMHIQQLKQRDRDDTSLQLTLARTLNNPPLPRHVNFQLFHSQAQLQSRLVRRLVRRACIAERSQRPAERGHDVGSPFSLAKRFHHAEQDMRVPPSHTIVWIIPFELPQANLDSLVLAQHPSSICKLRQH